uniref:Uncharacterized protein n=1 Tax=Knipowitschia caucasica TaxID=637954 RepID=A0AAV2JKL4_KNICA
MQLEFGSFQIGWLAVGRWWAKLRPHLLQNKVILWITLDKKPVWLSTIAVDVTPQRLLLVLVFLPLKLDSSLFALVPGSLVHCLI